MALPLKANEVDTTEVFTAGELLYRRVASSELNSKGEVDPSRINISSFKREILSAPSVMRSRFSQAPDVLEFDCADRDTTGWLVFFVRVDSLPVGLLAGDGRSFDFYPVHIPFEKCGAHSVVASCISADAARSYVKPSEVVAYGFKTRFATALRLALCPLPIDHANHAPAQP